MLLLMSVPGLPLLMVFPTLRRHVPGFPYVAILPAAIVALLPITYAFELPGLMLNAGLGVDGISRLLLGMSVLLWLLVSILFSKDLSVSLKQPANNLLSSFFLVAMAGNFGAILAIDLVSFFSFSTLLGYALYGLIISGANESTYNATRRAGKIYLVLMIIADVVLFEVLLITALSNDNLRFAAVHQAMAQADASVMYLWLVVFAFAIKAGIWPLHFWLVVVLRRVRPATAILLSAVPVSIAMLGMLRWLPLGEISAPQSGLIIQATGVFAVFYAISLMYFGWQKNRQRKLVVIHALVLAGGLFMFAIGSGLSDAALWHQYGNAMYYFIASLGFASVILLAMTLRVRSGSKHSATTAAPVDAASTWFELWAASLIGWAGKVSAETVPGWRSWWFAKMRYLLLLLHRGQRVITADERLLRVWSLAMTLFLSLAVLITFILVLSGGSAIS